MRMFPAVSFMLALVAAIFFYVGLGGWVLVPFMLTVAAAVPGIILGDKEYPGSSRIACALAIVLAGTPLVAPKVQAFRLAQLERARAAETKPMYDQLATAVDALKPKIQDYFKKYGVMPELQAAQWLPYIDAQGQLHQRTPAPDLQLPSDPFKPDAKLRMIAVRDTGVLFVSAGQDGQNEMPLPGVSIDGPPMYPLASFATTGVDPRTVTYDPTNGALGLGDIVMWHGRGKYEEAFDPLFKAWDLATARSPWAPTVKKAKTEIDKNPQSGRDATAADKLLGEGEPLAALALASRGLQARDIYPAQWNDADRTLDRVRGIALYNLGAYREAADALNNHLADSPNDAVAHYYMGACLFLGGDRGAATQHFAAGSQINPADPVRDASEAAFQAATRGQTPVLPEPWVIKWQKSQAAAVKPEAAAEVPKVSN